MRTGEDCFIEAGRMNKSVTGNITEYRGGGSRERRQISNLRDERILVLREPFRYFYMIDRPVVGFVLIYGR